MVTGRAVPSSTEEVADRAPGAQNVQRHAIPVPRQSPQFSIAFRSVPSPNAPGQRPLFAQAPQSRLVTAARQLEANRTLANAADERSPCADRPRRIEEHDRVRALKPKVKCGVVVAIDNPPVPGEQVSLRLAPFDLRRLHPARLPEVNVEVDDGRAG